MAQRINFTSLTNIGAVADPEFAQDAATKAYVDARGGGGGTLQSLQDVSLIEPVFTQIGTFTITEISTNTITLSGDITSFFKVGDFLRGTNTAYAATVQISNIQSPVLQFANSVSGSGFTIGGNIWRLDAILTGASLIWSNAQNHWVASNAGTILPLGLSAWATADNRLFTASSSTSISSVIVTSSTALTDTWTFLGTSVAGLTSFTYIVITDALGRFATGIYVSAADASTPTAILNDVLVDRIAGGGWEINTTYVITLQSGKDALQQFAAQGSVDYAAMDNTGVFPSYLNNARRYTGTMVFTELQIPTLAIGPSTFTALAGTTPPLKFSVNDTIFIESLDGTWNVTECYVTAVTGTSDPTATYTLNTNGQFNSRSNLLAGSYDVRVTHLLPAGVGSINFLAKNILLEAGENVAIANNFAANTITISAQLPSTGGAGWTLEQIITPSATASTTAWTGAASFPFFRNDGQVTLASGFTLGVHPGGGNWNFNSQADIGYLAAALQSWHNSQINAITTKVTVDGFDLQWQSDPPPPSATISQTDAQVQGLFDISNPNSATDSIISLGFDSAGTYVRAAPSTISGSAIYYDDPSNPQFANVNIAGVSVQSTAIITGNVLTIVVAGSVAGSGQAIASYFAENGSTVVYRFANNLISFSVASAATAGADNCTLTLTQTVGFLTDIPAATVLQIGVPTTTAITDIAVSSPIQASVTTNLLGRSTLNLSMPGDSPSVPVINFVAAATGSVNQVFTDPLLVNYANTNQLSVTANGSTLNVSNYALVGTSLTITGFLPANAIVQVQPSNKSAGGAGGSSALQELTDVFVNEPQYVQVGTFTVTAIGATSIDLSSSATGLLSIGDYIRGGRNVPPNVPSIRITGIDASGTNIQFTGSPAAYFAVTNSVYRLPNTLNGSILSFDNATNRWVASAAGGVPNLNQVLAVGNQSAIPFVFQDLAATPKSIALSAPSAITNNYTLKLPDSQATTNGQVLSNDGAGNLSWETVSGGGGTTIPVINFTSSATASANQTFTNVALGNYENAAQLSVSVNGATLNSSNYSLNSTVLTIVSYLLALSVVQVQPANAGSGGSGGSNPPFIIREDVVYNGRTSTGTDFVGQIFTALSAPATIVFTSNQAAGGAINGNAAITYTGTPVDPSLTTAGTPIVVFDNNGKWNITSATIAVPSAGFYQIAANTGEFNAVVPSALESGSYPCRIARLQAVSNSSSIPTLSDFSTDYWSPIGAPDSNRVTAISRVGMISPPFTYSITFASGFAISDVAPASLPVIGDIVTPSPGSSFDPAVSFFTGTVTSVDADNGILQVNFNVPPWADQQLADYPGLLMYAKRTFAEATTPDVVGILFNDNTNKWHGVTQDELLYRLAPSTNFYQAVPASTAQQIFHKSQGFPSSTIIQEALSGTTAAQIKYLNLPPVAGSTGQVLTVSNGSGTTVNTAWTSPANLASSKAVYTANATFSGTGSSSSGVFTSEITQQFNNLGLTLNFANGTLTNFVPNAVYEFNLSARSRLTTTPVTIEIFYACSGANTVSTSLAYGAGAVVTDQLLSTNRTSDYISASVTGYWTTALSTNLMYFTYYADATALNNNLNVLLQLTITRIS